MQLKTGSKVRFLHEVGSGIILKINDKTAVLLDENGFEMEYPIHLLVPQMSASEDELLKAVSNQGKINIPLKKDLFTKKRKGEQEWKVDLHMENLTDTHRNMTNHEIVTFQLNHFKAFLKTAENAKIGRLIVVHGVGSGKLKEEIKLLINGINGAEIFDADYTEYGMGASIIERKYNIR
ncbi:MAG: hypothetical protein WC044_03950 [Crocinitomicaceae bacterium]